MSSTRRDRDREHPVTKRPGPAGVPVVAHRAPFEADHRRSCTSGDHGRQTNQPRTTPAPAITMSAGELPRLSFNVGCISTCWR
jgi:hypothetical protein